MLLITKELAEAVIEFHFDNDTGQCQSCGAGFYNANYAKEHDSDGELIHVDNCIVVRAKLLLEQEWGIK